MEVVEKGTFEKYAAYKISGIDRLGNLPEDWKLKRFRNLFSFSKGLNITKENLQEDGIPCVNYGEIHSKYGFEVNPEKHLLKCVSEEYLKISPKSLLSYGDFVFADTSEDIEGSGNFTYLNSQEKTFAGYHTVIARLKTDDLRHRFLAYLIDSVSFRDQLRKAVKGVKVYSITNGILKNTTLWCPPLPEQTAIARFLDEKTTKIDQAIAQKEKLIALLKERKQIMIQQAVTKGLDPNVKMKDSAIDWIGEIPRHWEVKKLKYVLSERNERSLDGNEAILMMSQVHGLVVRSEFHDKAEVAQSTVGNKMVYTDDLVFNKLKAHLGVFFKSNIPYIGIVSPDYAVYTTNGIVPDLKFLELLLRLPVYISQFICKATGIVEGLIRLYTDDLFSIKIPVPPKNEQGMLLNYIETQTSKFDQSISLQEKQIEKLREYKQVLIDSAVTGKIKVS